MDTRSEEKHLTVNLFMFMQERVRKLIHTAKHHGRSDT